MIITVFSVVGDKRCSLDTVRVNGDLPVCALYVSDTNELGPSDHVYVVFEIRRRQGLTDKMLIDRTPVIDTEPRLTIFASHYRNG